MNFLSRHSLFILSTAPLLFQKIKQKCIFKFYFRSCLVNKKHINIIDGRKFVIKLVEEWGCNLGEDAFMTEVDVDSRPETFSQPINVSGMDEVQGE